MAQGPNEGATAGRSAWDKEEHGAVFGALHKGLARVDFPASLSKIMQLAGGENVAPGRDLPLVKYLNLLPERRYETADDVARTLNALWQDSRGERGQGWGASALGGNPTARDRERADVDTTPDIPAAVPAGPHQLVGRKIPPYEVIGVDALAPLLDEVRFPATKREIVGRIGNYHVPISPTKSMAVHEIIERAAPERFASAHEVAAALNRHWDAIIGHEGRGGRSRQGDDTSGQPSR